MYSKIKDSLRPRVPTIFRAVAAVRNWSLARIPIMRPVTDMGHYSKPRLLIEVTHTADVRFVTGIQRVVLRLTQALGEKTDPPFEIVAVQLRKEGSSFRMIRATDFEKRITGKTHSDETIKIRLNDVLFMLDSSWDKFPRYASAIFPVVRAQKGKIVSCLFDLIPITHPQFCDRYIITIYSRWLPLMLEHSDAVLSISKATQDALVTYLHERQQKTSAELNFFHLGADFREHKLSSRSKAKCHVPTVLMVGTIEPRKGYSIAVDAFELLWTSNRDIRLHIVGKFGWLVQDLVKRLKGSPEFGQRLVLTMNASDQDLVNAYSDADVVLSASYAEGFGLPLVEAAAFGKSLIVSDIPPYREICGDRAIYFDAGDPKSLAEKLDVWLGSGQLPPPPQFISWLDSANELLACLKSITARQD